MVGKINFFKGFELAFFKVIFFKSVIFLCILFLQYNLMKSPVFNQL